METSPDTAVAIASPPGLPVVHLPVIRPPRQRPDRPKDFPLYAHACGQWAKKVRGKIHYFGPWRDHALALRRWEAQKTDLLNGRPPRPVGPDEILLHELCNEFLVSKKAGMERGELGERSWDEYLQSCKRLCRVLGRETAISHLVPGDFEKLRADMAKTFGPVRIGNEIQRCRCVFKYGLDQELYERLPTYGAGFKKPSRKTLRKHRAEKGKRMFDAEQLRKILEQAKPTLRAMLLLGINCGFGNHDVATIGRKHCDLKAGWVNYPRPKTGIERRAKLWPETVRAIRKVLRLRDRRLKKKGEAKTIDTETGGRGDAETAAVPASPCLPVPASSSPRRRYKKLLFLTRGLQPWTGKGRKGAPRVSEEFGRLLRRCGLHRPGLNFYALRHTFQTVGGATKDAQAVSAIMGHAARGDDMSAVYTEEIDDARLAAVAAHVRSWLFPAK